MTAPEAELERAHFFVSYARADRGWASWIAWELEDVGYRVVLRDWDFVPGSNWVDKLQSALVTSQRILAVLSPAYLAAEKERAEWEHAWASDRVGHRRRLLPIRVGECQYQGMLDDVVNCDLFGTTEREARDRLLQAVSAAIHGRAKPLSRPQFPGCGGAPLQRPRFPGELPPIWNVPARNPNFAGRGADLDTLERVLDQGGTTVAVSSLRGMGGVGKTQTAIEYAHRNAGDYDLVWWINAEHPASLAGQFATLCDEMGASANGDPQSAIRAVHRALRERSRWLLVFDDVRIVDHVAAILPSGPGKILITTRREGFKALGEVLDLSTLNRESSIALLQQRAPHLETPDADRLADRLGDLPLALDQAAAYLDQTHLSVVDYLDRLRDRASEMFEKGRVLGHPDRVATVWSVSIEQLEVTAPAAVALLQLCAWLAPEPIPLDLFSGHAGLLAAPLDSVCGDPVAFAETVAALVDLSLARRSGSDLEVHRLVQDVTRARPPAASRSLGPEFHRIAVRLLRADLPDQPWDHPESWPRYRQLLPHVLAVAQHAQQQSAGADPVDIAWLLTRVSEYLGRLGRFEEALAFQQRALGLTEEVLGPEHLEVAVNLNHVGWLLSALGRYGEALPLQRRALEVHRQGTEPDRPAVATALNHVGWTLSKLGRSEEALELQHEALEIRERALGERHLEVATDLNHVGWVLSSLLRYEEAAAVQQRALDIRESHLDAQHPAVATVLLHLGRSLAGLRRYGEALPLHERALRVREEALGPHHPEVATALSHLGRTLAGLGRYGEALPLHERALRIQEEALGSQHPDVATAFSHLARTLAGLGRFEEARALHERALRIHEETLGPDHPEVAVDLRNLALSLNDLGDTAGAQALAARAVGIVATQLGPRHQLTVALRRSLATVDSAGDLGDGATATT